MQQLTGPARGPQLTLTFGNSVLVEFILKSYNLQCNTPALVAGLLGGWNDCLSDQPSDVPGIIFFIISNKILCKNIFNLFILFFYNSTKIEIKSFECPKSVRNYEKK